MKNDGLRLDRETGIWQVDVTVEGIRRQVSAKTRSLVDARRFRDKIRADLWAEAKLGRKMEARTWADAVRLYLERAERKANRSISDARLHLEWLEPRLGGPLARITDELIADTLEAKRREGVQRMVRGEWRRLRDVSPTTLNRYYSTIHAVLTCALQRGWIDRVPHWERAAEEAREEYLTVEQWRQLRRELPDHIRVMAEFSLLTGQRKAVTCGLRWDWITPNAILVPPAVMKAKQAHRIDLTRELRDLLLSQHGQHHTHVFTYEGEPIAEPAGAAWRKALKRAGLPEDFRWHSLRSTFAVWHLEAGTPIETVMRMGGWKRIDVLLRHYAHHTAKAAERHVGTITDLVLPREDSAGRTRTVSGLPQVTDLGWRMGLEPTTTGITISDKERKST